MGKTSEKIKANFKGSVFVGKLGLVTPLTIFWLCPCFQCRITMFACRTEAWFLLLSPFLLYLSYLNVSSRLFLEIFESVTQAPLDVLCTCGRRSEKNVPAENGECSRWPHFDLVEKFLQNFEIWHFVPTCGACRLHRLMICGVPLHFADIFACFQA